MKRICRHCQQYFVSRPLGLCWRCYYTPSIRERYPSTSKFAPRNNDSFGGHALAEPTTACPGEEAKVVAMAERARLGLSIFHPEDGHKDLT